MYVENVEAGNGKHTLLSIIHQYIKEGALHLFMVKVIPYFLQIPLIQRR